MSSPLELPTCSSPFAVNPFDAFDLFFLQDAHNSPAFADDIIDGVLECGASSDVRVMAPFTSASTPLMSAATTAAPSMSTLLMVRPWISMCSRAVCSGTALVVVVLLLVFVASVGKRWG